MQWLQARAVFHKKAGVSNQLELEAGRVAAVESGEIVAGGKIAAVSKL